MTPRCTHPALPHRFSPGSKLFFGAVVGWLTCWVRSYGSCDMEHAAPGSVLRASRSFNASPGLPGPPAGGRGKDGRMHNDSSRYSPAAQREVASLSGSCAVPETASLFALLWCAHARALYGTRMPPRMCHRTRQESTIPRLRFSCDLTVARPPVKVAFANTHLIFGVRLEEHEHEQK